MHKLKFYHVVTGQRIMVPVKAIAGRYEKDGKIYRNIADTAAIILHFNKQGFVRAGKNQILTDLEKAMVANAPALIAMAKADAYKAEHKLSAEAAAKAVSVIVPNKESGKAL